jgi:hypothetical protein
VRLRHSTVDPSAVTGYAVTVPDARTADGSHVWYGGGRLAADLTLPRLRKRWVSGSGKAPTAKTSPPARVSGDTRRRILGEAVAEFGRAHEELRRAVADGSTSAAAATATAAADAATVMARVVEGRWNGPLSQAAEQFDRAARGQYARIPSHPHGPAEALRASARLLAAVRRLHPDDDALQAAELISRLASLAHTVALLRRHERRGHQATAARRAAIELRTVAANLVKRRPQMTGQARRTSSPARQAVTPRPGRGRSGFGP